MKICWDNLENIYLTKKGNLKNGSHVLYENECLSCGKSFLGRKDSRYCDNKCMTKCEVLRREKSEKYKGKNNPFYNKNHTEKTKEKIREKRTGTKSPEHSERMSEKGNPNWKGGYKDIPYYDTYASQINWIEEVRRNKEDPNILEVKCTYCGKWFIPTWNSIHNRLSILKGNSKHNSENRLYCSDGCKKACPIYGKSANMLMKEDAVKFGRESWWKLPREVQPQIRQIVFSRDDYKCIKCNNTTELHCHHIYPVATDPLLSADIDNCITLCNKCHKKTHKKDGCKYGQLRICI